MNTNNGIDYTRHSGVFMEQFLYLNNRAMTNTYLPPLTRDDMELIDVLLKKVDRLDDKLEKQNEELQEIKARLDTLDGEKLAWGKVWGWLGMIAIFIGWVWEQVRVWFVKP